MHFIVDYFSIPYDLTFVEIISEIPSPPPYSTHLPSYDEISQSLSPLQTQTTSETDQTEQPNSQSGD